MALNVLLVDDEEEFADAFSERLRLRGFTLHVANSGEKALRMIADGVAKVVILDLKMPGMDGIEVLRRIGKSHPGLQVMILSGHGSEKDEAIARNLGAFEYLRKPADIEAVLEALKRAENRLGRVE
ncbi:MAG: response regulator [Desulfobacteraceae bacterium]|nr:response regulator [Desulfobacteraceae bacterium]